MMKQTVRVQIETDSDDRGVVTFLDDDFDAEDADADDGANAMSAKELGNLGECLAAAYLEQRGFEIVMHNYRCSEGEADLIAYDPEEDEIVLVEVKTRRARSLGCSIYPEEAVDERKKRRYRRIAGCYLMEHYPVPSLRFDVAAVTLVDGCMASIEYFYNAFEWDGGR